MPESDLERERREDLRRTRSHGAKKLMMGAFLAVLIAVGAFVLFTSTSPKEVAQQDVTTHMPTFTPPASPPPIPLPDAAPKPKADISAPAANPYAGHPVTLPTPPPAPQ